MEESETINKLVFYPVVDFHPLKATNPKELRAQWTGEYRKPKKGEWYLSGAIIEAYQAKNDMSFPYYIARLVLVENIVTYRIKKVVE